MAVDLAVIIVNWNVRDLLRRCLASLAAAAQHSGLTLAVVVVDNGSTDGSVVMVRADFPGVQLVEAGRNLGFTAGNNLGLRALAGADFAALPPCVCFLNPDTEVRPDALAQLRAYLLAHPDTGAVGPRLRYPDGSVQSSRRRFPTLAVACLQNVIVLGRWTPGRAVLRRYHMADQPDDVTQPVDWLVGACLLVRREALRQVGSFDEGFFMYSEEVDWCKRAKDAGWQVVYLPSAEVIHHEGQSSAQAPASKHIHFHTSKIRYFRKHHGARAAAVLRLFLLLNYATQWAEEGAKWLVGHKRPLRAARLRVYAAVLRSGLRPYRGP